MMLGPGSIEWGSKRSALEKFGYAAVARIYRGEAGKSSCGRKSAVTSTAAKERSLGLRMPPDSITSDRTIRKLIPKEMMVTPHGGPNVHHYPEYKANERDQSQTRSPFFVHAYTP
jgi:hypothetical protein